MCNAEALGSIRLGELVLLDIEAKVAHHILPHLEHCGFGRIKAKATRTLPLDLVIFFFMIGLRAGIVGYPDKITSCPVAV